ncbi:MAG: ATP-binding cassette domain-containing protein [Trueperaceae bacterium]
MQTAAEAIALSGIQVYYDDPGKAVLDIDRLTIPQGERVALIGSSGAGKTTLLRLINGYVHSATGSLHVLGYEKTAPNARRHDVRVGFVFQSFNLVERATVFENVLWGRLGHAHAVASLFGHFSRHDKNIAMQAVDEVALRDQAAQRCDTLSGGQQQRVAIARVLAQEPEIILADEPVSSLDPALADDALNLLIEVSKGRTATLVMSLHQPDLARRYASRIIGLRAGRVVLDERADTLSEAAIRAVYEGEVESAAEEP